MYTHRLFAGILIATLLVSSAFLLLDTDNERRETGAFVTSSEALGQVPPHHTLRTFVTDHITTAYQPDYLPITQGVNGTRPSHVFGGSWWHTSDTGTAIEAHFEAYILYEPRNGTFTLPVEDRRVRVDIPRSNDTEQSFERIRQRYTRNTPGCTRRNTSLCTGYQQHDGYATGITMRKDARMIRITVCKRSAASDRYGLEQC